MKTSKNSTSRPYDAEYHKSYYANNKAEISAKRKGQRLKSRYGISQEEYDALLTQQGGTCAICGTADPKGSSDRFHVDHCHDTGAVRGLLCMPCNSGIGQLKDSIPILSKAIDYLRAHNG